MPRKAKPTSAANAKTPISTRTIVNTLREHIRVGTLMPGQRLVEADIVANTGASRGKVREALQRLETEGLVSIEEFRGASVRKLSMNEIHQIYKARMALEGMLAAEFAAADKPKLKKQLQNIQEQMNALEKTGDHGLFAKLNDDWHSLIIKGSGNEYAAHFLGQLSVPVYRLLFTSFYNAQRIDQANADHKVITKAIVKGQADIAEKAMRTHINDGLNALMEINSKLHF